MRCILHFLRCKERIVPFCILEEDSGHRILLLADGVSLV